MKRGARHGLSRLAAGLTIVLLSSSGCGTDRAERDRKQGDPEDVTVTRTAREGPVTLTLSVTPAELDPSRHATVRVEITSVTGVTVTPDSYERALAEDEHRFEYRIVATRRERAVPTDNGKLRWMYESELEFILPGEYELPPASLSFIDERGTSAQPGDEAGVTLPAEPTTLETESLTLVVRPPAGPELTQEEMMTITTLDPIELPRRWSYGWWIGATAGVMVIAFVIWFVRRRRRRPETVVVIPAHEWAQSELATLIAEDLIARGLFREFCYRISDVTRGYIERRFHMAAPEMTTEEFLNAVATDRRFGQIMTEELNRFLGACDLVKYAKHQPTTVEAKSLLDTTYDFVERTRERPGHAGERSTSPRSIEEHAA